MIRKGALIRMGAVVLLSGLVLAACSSSQQLGHHHDVCQ